MSRFERLLEVLTRLPEGQVLTVAQLADEFQVSRRTMLRDLHALSMLGVPLSASPGPGGGYTLIRPSRSLALEFTVDEVLGILVSYEGFLELAETPFASATRAAVAKIQQTLAPEPQQMVNRVRRHVHMALQPKSYRAPLLGDLLQASVERQHLEITYQGRSGISTRVIFPYGIYSSMGFWYGAAYDSKRQAHVSLRVDRIQKMRPSDVDIGAPQYSLREWLDARDSEAERVRLRARLTPNAIAYADLSWLDDGLMVHEDRSGTVDMDILVTDISMWARYFLRLGTEAKVEAPQSLVEEIQQRLRELVNLYNS